MGRGMKRRSLALLLAGSVASALAASAASSAAAENSENCYGVALKGQNDCAAANHSCAGQASVDYDGASWKSVPKGSCLTMKTPYGTGALKQIKRPT